MTATAKLPRLKTRRRTYGSATPGLRGLVAGQSPARRRDRRQERLRRLCQARGLPQPVLRHQGFDACWAEYDVAIVIVTEDAAKDRKKVNRAAVAGFFCLLVSDAEWRSGAALDLVAKVRDT